MEKIDEHKAFGGWQRRYTHTSEVCHCKMTFALFVPPLADTRRVPVVYWLSGLTCNDENFVNKAGAQRMAAELGIAIVAPDTSPRGDDVADEDSYDMGKGAGFYVNATQAPWASHYQMYDYVVKELPNLLADEFGTTLDLAREAISGHSMGGHGALVIGLRNPDRFAAISAFSPVCAPSEVPWGEKAFAKYLGDDREAWFAYDATAIMENADNGGALPPIRVEQGLNDQFFEVQLHPHRLEQAADHVGAEVEVCRREGYDHSYFFIASFMEDHLRFLAMHLGV